MGCGKSQPADAATPQDRRRLSLSTTGDQPVSAEKQESRGNVIAAEGSSILLHELLPKAGRRLSVSGLPSEMRQQGFTDKRMNLQSDEHVKPSDFNVGYACKKGLKPESPNQDDFCILRTDDIGIYGVFDGHGSYGHDISSFVHETLPRCLVQDKDFNTDIDKAYMNAFPETHKLCQEAAQEGRFDCALSGTTSTMIVHRDGYLHAGHVGDSRAVLARGNMPKLIAEDLTNDHKPNNEPEKKRIQSAGGQVRRIGGDITHRVFVMGKTYPGLAMSRSIGDTVGGSVGVSSIPDTKKLKIEKDFRFFMLCSDGVWEFISSQEAVEIISRFPPSDVQQAADELASESWKRWMHEEGDVVDDITVIVVWLSNGAS
eukprot:gnl/TRDRNA2_/TRDRNA2_171349_c4_seq1.p1 gnl/TRDRNA2_/TRDRNA2_171349_c4~~gnl/TRDRNA2_/TRDRNA2_171349_c4_seq1.p1  ORF type:complete len:372 (-),score=73.86 gnl/TRDRNA2_/TRDRNA2_171349_c4_seq1:267-1382(-)